MMYLQGIKQIPVQIEEILALLKEKDPGPVAIFPGLPPWSALFATMASRS
jgi:hypothetical protein